MAEAITTNDVAAAQNGSFSAGLASWATGILGVANQAGQVYNTFKGQSDAPAATATQAPAAIVQQAAPDNKKMYIIAGVAVAVLLVILLVMRRK